MWTTIYIKGRPKFKSKVQKALKYSGLDEGDEYITGQDSKYALYWLPPEVSLRAFKLAIGAKIIWEYRLKFFFELKDRKIDDNFTNEEQELIEEYREK